MLATSCWERLSTPSNWRVDNRESGPEAGAMPEIRLTAFHHWLGLDSLVINFNSIISETVRLAGDKRPLMKHDEMLELR